MGWNVPDDWGSYYYSCGCHASEGGCSCEGGQVDDSERPWLSESGYSLDGGIWDKVISVKTHTCRRDHKDGTIKKGDRYRVYTRRQIYDDCGESWISKSKHKIK